MPDTLYNILFVAEPDAFDDATSLSAVINLVFNNPLASFETMDLKGKYAFKDPADKSKVLATLLKKGDQSIQLKPATSLKLVAIFKKNKFNCTVYFTFSSTFISEQLTATSLINYLSLTWQATPRRLYAAASADTQYGDVLMSAGISQVPGIFNFNVSWLHWLSKSSYSEWYKKEDILAAPVYYAEELNDGALFLQPYQHPADYLDPQTMEKIKDITNYLNNKRQK